MAAPRSTRDPRTLSPAPVEDGVGPVVALPRQGLPRPVLIAFAVLAAVILFVILDSRRRALPTSETMAQDGRPVATSPAPPLYVPAPPPVQLQPAPRFLVPTPQAPAPRIQQQIVPAPRPQIVYVPQPAATEPVPVPPQPRVASGPALVVDTTGGGTPDAPAASTGDTAAAAAPATIAGTRTRAGMLANRSTTVPQGTLIPAVMETAFNSTRPGLARAIVSSDVRGFDGTRVLISRGSRLIGEYRSDVAPGQRRALVNWVRLIRPDGVTIAISSPATDPLGRGGIRANVNSHFWQRFTGAILRSTIDLGITLAAGAANTPLVLLPGGLGAGSGESQTTQVTPTLTVRQGTSISVFVARDLDFTGVERRR